MATNNFLEAKHFLETLYSRYFAEHDGYVELRFVMPSKDGNVFSKFYLKAELTEAAWTEITELNKTHHVYFGVNPRPLSQGKKQEDIRNLVCFWADVDGKDFEGGKKEALKRVKEFPIVPTIVVDSGHGFHLYWVLKDPIVGTTEEQRTAFKQTLAGIVDRLGADGSKLHLDSCLRLPGTMNIKDPDHLVECCVIDIKEEDYEESQFSEFRNVEYQEPTGFGDPLPDFGVKTVLVSHEDIDKTKKDVEKLMIPSWAKKLIFTGALARGKGRYPSRSERDMAIICSLVYWDYTYATIRSIFYNPLLGCSNRLRDLPEQELQWDVRKALGFVQKWESGEAAEAARISEIRRTKGLSTDEKRKRILDFITADLLTSDNPAGRGFKDDTQDQYYFFDNKTKTLINLESMDFYTFILYRYRVPERDFVEIKAHVTSIIRWELRTTATPRRVSYWDKEKFIAYISDNANGIYRLDGKEIKFLENGADGVFFEYDPELTPWTFNPKQEAAKYFETVVEERRIQGMTFPSTVKLGLNLERFYQPDCLLNKFLVARARFGADKDNPLTPWYQQLVLIIYFYSQFFESKLQEKPVACFVGMKESGKSFLATAIGKIFDGNSFESSALPEKADHLAIVMGRRRYLVLDNLDSRVGGDMLNLICSAATGVAWRKRKHYENDVEVSVTPHCFLAITSREPKFTRDDLVSRLLVFSTQKIDHPISRSQLMDPMLAARSEIITEVLWNLNTIVTMLRLEDAQTKRPDYRPIKCISRLADWETFGRAICGGGQALLHFCCALEMMQEKKDVLAIEGEDVYQVLHKIIYEDGEAIIPLPTSLLYEKLVDAAREMRFWDFQRYCKTPRSLGMWLFHNGEELKRRFQIEVFDYPHGQREYAIRALGDDTGPVILPEARMLEIAKCASVEDLHRLLNQAKEAKALYRWERRENGDYFIETRVTEIEWPSGEGLLAAVRARAAAARGERKQEKAKADDPRDDDPKKAILVRIASAAALRSNEAGEGQEDTGEKKQNPIST